MPDQGSPTVRRRRLAAELHRLRERSGLTGDQVAERLGWSPSKISRIENTRSGVKLPDAQRLLDLYGVHGSHRDELITLARQGGHKGWWETYSANLPARFATFIGMEAEAESIRSWEPQVIPGLLQIESYALEVIRNWQAFDLMPQSTIEDRVKVRLERQQVLYRQDPPRYSTVLDESVLLRRFGDQSIMRAQLKNLLEISQLANVVLRILRLAGNHPISTGAFTLFHFPQTYGVRISDVVCIENMESSLYVEEEREACYYERALDHLERLSLDPAESRSLIANVLRTTWR